MQKIKCIKTSEKVAKLAAQAWSSSAISIKLSELKIHTYQILIIFNHYKLLIVVPVHSVHTTAQCDLGFYFSAMSALTLPALCLAGYLFLHTSYPKSALSFTSIAVCTHTKRLAYTHKHPFYLGTYTHTLELLCPMYHSL